MKKMFENILLYYLKRNNLIKIMYRYEMKKLNIPKTDIKFEMYFLFGNSHPKPLYWIIIFLKVSGAWVNKNIWFDFIFYQIFIKNYNKHMQLISESLFAHYNFSDFIVAKVIKVSLCLVTVYYRLDIYSDSCHIWNLV